METKTVWVFIEEEYGYKYWLWDTQMSREELFSWWKSLETVNPFFWGADNIPMGEMHLLSPYDVPVHELIIKKNCTSYEEFDLFGEEENLDWESGEGGEVVGSLASNLLADFYMHLHTDGDSLLCNPDGSNPTRHAGYDPNYFKGGE